MKPRDIALPGLVLLVGLLIGTYLLTPLVQTLIFTSTPPLLLAFIYYAGLPILAVAAAGFSFSWFRGRIREDRHRDEILQVLKTPVSSLGEARYTSNILGEMIIQHPLSWAESNPLYPNLMAHLANYKDALSLLAAAHQYSEKQVTEIVREIREIMRLVDERLESFTALPTLDTPPNPPKPYYNKRLVRYAIFSDAKSLQEKSTQAELQVAQLQVGKRKTNQLLHGSDVLAVGSKAALTRLDKMIHSLVSDAEITRAAEEIYRLERLLKTNSALADFEARTKQIAFALSAGRHALPGHCERCP